MHIIQLRDCPASPWKNGGGSTRQLLISPSTATLDNFDYRISLANVASAGPFSCFDGIDRQLMVLQGAGLNLQLAAQPTISLTPDSPPLCFTGETAISSQLLDGAVIDFNVMTRRGRYQASIEKRLLYGQQSVSHQATLCLLLALDNGLAVQKNGQLQELAVWDAVLLAAGESLQLPAATHCRCWQVELTALS
ncbi:HutD family protein [Neisseriaceae bacterium TC5R-5]|nr:HutD family protein [Neisseriaceae bacterium TC5R-5]